MDTELTKLKRRRNEQEVLIEDCSLLVLFWCTFEIQYTRLEVIDVFVIFNLVKHLMKVSFD